MLTVQWVYQDRSQEIPPGSVVPARGFLQLRIQHGSRDMAGYHLTIKDPFHIPLYQSDIPQVHSGETYQMRVPLTNYLPNGTYLLELYNQEGQVSYQQKIVIQSRRKPKQVFLAEHKMLVRNMGGKVDSFEMLIHPIPSSFLLQRTGPVFAGPATEITGKRIIQNELIGRSQKTVSWKQVVKPQYLPIDLELIEEYPDEYYILHPKIHFDDEAGLEISQLPMEQYNGTTDISYPIRVIRDVLNHVHRNMKYVKQSHERGLLYALKHRRGDCTEYSAYFVSLLRRLGIEARLVSGMGRSIHNNWISHAFAEVKIQGAWVPIDTVKPPKPYLQIGNMGDLVGIYWNNWLSKKDTEFRLELQMHRNSRKPVFNVTRKVTETGAKQLSDKKKRQRGIRELLQQKPKLEIRMIDDVFVTKKVPKDTTSILVLAKIGEYRKVRAMSYYQRGKQPLNTIQPYLTDDSDHEAIALDRIGRVIARGMIDG